MSCKTLKFIFGNLVCGLTHTKIFSCEIQAVSSIILLTYIGRNKRCILRNWERNIEEFSSTERFINVDGIERNDISEAVKTC